MRFIHKLGLLALLLVIFQGANGHAVAGPANYTSSEVAHGGGFVGTGGIHFMLNGKPLFLNGFNAYWMMYMAADPSTRGKVSSAIELAAEKGMNIARTWAFSDGGNRALQISPGSYDENVFKVKFKKILKITVSRCTNQQTIVLKDMLWFFTRWSHIYAFQGYCPILASIMSRYFDTAFGGWGNDKWRKRVRRRGGMVPDCMRRFY